MNQNTRDLIDQIKKRLANTTPGQWYVNYLDDSHHMNLVAITTRPDSGKHEALPYDDEDQTIRNSIVATTLIQASIEGTKQFIEIDVDESDYFDPSKGERLYEDAEFIAHAKNDIEYLVSLVESLLEERHAE